MTINGSSEPDFAGTPIVVLDGSSAGAGVSGLHISSGSAMIHGLAISNFTDHGIYLEGNGNNTIGGITTGAANIISSNGGNGIGVASNSNKNTLRGNAIYANSGLAIDLNLNGVSASDPDDSDAGANNLQNYPVLTTVSDSGSGVAVTGTMTSSPDTTFTLDFYASTAADSSTYGEAERYIGSLPITTDGSGHATLEGVLSGATVMAGEFITATATDIDRPLDSLSFSITGGTDAALFSVDASSGQLVFNTAQKHDRPDDANADGRYEVNVTVSDRHAAVDEIDLLITLTDVNVAPTAINIHTPETYTEDVSLDLGNIIISDVDSQNVRVILTLSSPDAGILTTSHFGSAQSTFDQGVWSATGSVDDVNHLLAELAFEPNPNTNKDFMISVTIDDGVAPPLMGGKIISGIAVGDTPEVSPATAFVGATSDLIIVKPNERDGAEVTHFHISGITNGTLYLSDGLTEVTNGQFITVIDGESGLLFVPTVRDTNQGSFLVDSSEDGINISAQSHSARSTIDVARLTYIPTGINAAKPDFPTEVVATETSKKSPPASVETSDEDKTSPEAIFSRLAGIVESAFDERSLPELDIARPQPAWIQPQSTEPQIVFTHDTHLSQSQAAQINPLSTLLQEHLYKIRLQEDAVIQSSYDHLYQSLNELKKETFDQMQHSQTVVGSAIAVSTGLSAGYVIWMLRSGMLISSVMFSLPAWRIADPLPILAGSQNKNNDDESLLSIIKNKTSREKTVEKPKTADSF